MPGYAMPRHAIENTSQVERPLDRGGGLWPGKARPGDSIDVVSDDRACDAVGDVMAALCVLFRRFSSRRLADLPSHDGLG
jgi:hypothetical protein